MPAIRRHPYLDDPSHPTTILGIVLLQYSVLRQVLATTSNAHPEVSCEFWPDPKQFPNLFASGYPGALNLCCEMRLTTIAGMVAKAVQAEGDQLLAA